MEERRQSQSVLTYEIQNLVKAFDEMKSENKEAHERIKAENKEAHNEIIKHQKETNGTVRDNKEWIDSNKTDIDDVVKDRKNFIKNMFNTLWKLAVVTVCAVFGLNFLK